MTQYPVGTLPRQVTFLSIDTEGHDPLVILGMLYSLAGSVIDLFEFENHELGHWQHLHLTTIIDILDILGFDCYWQVRTI